MATGAARPSSARMREGETFPCLEPGCGKAYGRPQDLGRHAKTVHGVSSRNDRRAAAGLAPTNRRRNEEREAAAAIAPTLPVSRAVEEIRGQLARAAAPFEIAVARIDARLAAIRVEEKDLRDARREAVAVLGKLRGPAATPDRAKQARADGSRNRAASDLAVKQAQVEAYLRAHPDELAEGFTVHDLKRTWDSNGNGGGLAVGHGSTVKILAELHDRGVLRLDRITKGGGKVYKLIGGAQDE